MGAFRLDESAIEQYHRNGYWLFREAVFSPTQFERLTGIFEELLAKTNKRGDELDTPHFQHPKLFDFLLADAVLDLEQPLIGPNIGLWSSHFISKEPFTGRTTPWHEDTAYWKARFDRMDKIVTVWLAIDRSDQENGCMAIIPGTHNDDYSEYEAVDSKKQYIQNADTIRLR